MKKVFLLFLFLPWSVYLMAQTESVQDQFTGLNQGGMLVLGGWAVANIGMGTWGYYHSSGSTKYFHQMNAFWNLVNLGIATAGYFGNDFSMLSYSTSMDKTQQLQRVLLINGGLDVLYMGGGLLMRNLKPKNKDLLPRFQGYGNAVILQGAFLLVFDLALYSLNQRYENLFLLPLMDPLTGMAGMQFQYLF